jgi:hypothetical protein
MVTIDSDSLEGYGVAPGRREASEVYSDDELIAVRAEDGVVIPEIDEETEDSELGEVGLLWRLVLPENKALLGDCMLYFVLELVDEVLGETGTDVPDILASALILNPVN